MEKIMNSINLYPHHVSFSHNKINLFYSAYGLFTSLISYVLIISLIYYYSYDLIKKKNPKVKTIQSELSSNETWNLDELINELKFNLVLNFNLTEESSKSERLFDEKIYLYVEMYNKTEKTSEFYYIVDELNTNIELNEDRSSKYRYLYETEIIIDNQTKLIKFSRENNKKEVFKEIYLKELNITLKNMVFFAYFDFQKPENITEYEITKSTFGYSVRDNAMNTDEYERYIVEYDKKGLTDLGQSIIIDYTFVLMKTDSHLFLSYDKEENFLQIDFFYHYNDQYDISSDYKNGRLIKIEFRNIMIIYTRTYKKLLDVLSQLGGVFNPIIIFGKLLVSNFNEKKYKLSILNNLFTYEDITREVKKKQKIINNQDFYNRKISLVKKSHDFFKKLVYSNANKNIKKNTNKDFHKKSQEMMNFENDKFKKDERYNNSQKENNLSYNYDINRNFGEEYKNKSNLMNIAYSNVSQINSINPVNSIIKNEENGLNNLILYESKINQKEFFLQNNNSIINDSKNEMKMTDLNDRINTYLRKMKHSKNILLKYTTINFIISLICIKRMFTEELHKKEEIYKKILKKLDSYIEITNIMRLYENFEKMKFIMFNKHQMYCFDYIIHDVNFNNNEEEDKILFELSKYFEKTNPNIFEKNIDESIKIILKNDIKKLIGNQADIN